VYNFESEAEMKNNEKFVTVINCMDGRVQVPVNQYMLETFNADYLDTITEAGPNKILSEGIDEGLVGSIKSRHEVSTMKHHSKVVAIVGHYDCGGNPADEIKQIEEIEASVKLVKSWNSEIHVFGIWVDENWVVNPLEGGEYGEKAV
jgi:carbonic anhydrase